MRILLLAAVMFIPALASGFTLIGPNATLVNPSAGVTEALINMATDPMGRPVRVKEFYRWNYPKFTFAYDSTFVRFFGHNGMNAVSNSFRVMNDFFVPEDGRYKGVSQLQLISEYEGHFRTWYFNPSANVGNVTDIQSMTLGLLVNQLGLGNPHRYCFVIEDIMGVNVANSTGTFQIGIRNYDPYTYLPATIINGVQHSYYITSDSPGNNAAITIFDALEYAVSSDEENSAIAGIRDVVNFGGLAWPTVAPTVFRTPGVYFGPEDSKNLPVSNAFQNNNRTQPRHSLTFDDAGGLRYLYRTNNIVWETLDASITLVSASNMNPPPVTTSGLPPPIPPNQPFLTPQRRTIVGMVGSGLTPSLNVAAGGTTRPNNVAIVRDGLRGGIDKIEFAYAPYDSLIGQDYRQQVFAWTDVFVTNALPTDPVPANPPYFTQIVQRTATTPDIIFIAEDLGVAGNVLPVITLPTTAGWAGPNVGNTQQGNVANIRGPGTIGLPAANTSIQYIFTTRAPFYQVIWAGEPGIEGNSIVQFQWGWIYGTGPSDYITFPESDITQAEAITGPSGTAITINGIAVLDTSSGLYLASPFTINRSTDRVYIYANRTDTATEIHVMASAGATTPLQVIKATDHIVSDQLIAIGTGVFDNLTVGAGRFIRLANPKGNSVAVALGAINDGDPIITSTQYDGLALNTRKSLKINGSGFKTILGDVDAILFDDVSNLNLSELTVLAAPVQSDKQIVIPVDYFSTGTYVSGAFGTFSVNTGTRSMATSVAVAQDDFTRKIKVKRTVAGGTSAVRPRDHYFTLVGPGGDRATVGAIAPTITAVTTANGVATTWSRGTIADTITITGMALDLALSIEFLDGDGNLIQATDVLGFPPAPISLRSPIQPSTLATGVTIANIAGDSYAITIAPVAFGMNGNSIFDSASGNNVSTIRRAVIRTPFGTAIAPLAEAITIQP